MLLHVYVDYASQFKAFLECAAIRVVDTSAMSLQCSVHCTTVHALTAQRQAFAPLVAPAGIFDADFEEQGELLRRSRMAVHYIVRPRSAMNLACSVCIARFLVVDTMLIMDGRPGQLQCVRFIEDDGGPQFADSGMVCMLWALP